MRISHALLVVHHRLHDAGCFTLEAVEHICGYEEEPVDWEVAKENLIKELEEDPALGLRDTIENYYFLKATEEKITEINVILEKQS